MCDSHIAQYSWFHLLCEAECMTVRVAKVPGASTSHGAVARRRHNKYVEVSLRICAWLVTLHC